MKKMYMVDPEDFFNSGGSMTRRAAGLPFDELKAYKKFKKFLKKEEEEAKKNKKEDPVKHWFHKMTIAEKTMFFAIFGPPLGVGYVFGLLILCRGLASVAGIR
jgi:hypothetical protein